MRMRVAYARSWRSIPLVLGLCLTAASALAAGTRPISDFVVNQGSFCWPTGTFGCIPSSPACLYNPVAGCIPAPAVCCLQTPTVANYVSWTQPPAQPGVPNLPPQPALGAFVDYAGLANAWLQNQPGGFSLGTQISGTVVERALPDGRAAVRVTLNTSNALTYVTDVAGGPANFALAPLVFGNRASDVLGGAAPALGNSTLHVKFINTAPGAPLPDLFQLAFFPDPGQELQMLSFYSNASGPLASGGSGQATVVQSGLFFTPFNGAVGDGFPAEWILVQ
ncbi:MAG TPA: hypothetical protein VKF62_12745, partial [Planctomycetota bacterium]|nr:hypothetical protein [Planctomycetota bacterium]